MIATSTALYGYHCNYNNQVNDSDTEWYDSPVKIKLADSENILSVSCGVNHTVLVTENCVYSWGSKMADCMEINGMLGLGDANTIGTLPIKKRYDDNCYPINKINIKNGTNIKCSSTHNLLLTIYGLYSWGTNECGQLGIGDYLHQNIPTKINLDNVVDIDCSDSFSMAIVYDNVLKKYCLYGWGNNKYGQMALEDCSQLYLPRLIPIDGSVISVSCGKIHTLCLTTSGLYTFGNNIFAPTKINIENVVSICASFDSNTIITKNNMIYTWPIIRCDSYSFTQGTPNEFIHKCLVDYSLYKTYTEDRFVDKYEKFSWETSDEFGFKVCKLSIVEIERKNNSEIIQ
jgi:alpha-tubulin suppressor-like RCC1 family protein